MITRHLERSAGYGYESPDHGDFADRPQAQSHGGVDVVSRPVTGVHGVTTRPMVEDDSILLFELYASAHAQELARTGWATPQQRAFLRMQAQNQEAHFVRNHIHLDKQVVCIDGFSAGRALISRSTAGFELVDLALLPAFRGRGIGTWLVSRLLDEAEAAGVPVFTEVARNSVALRLCGRLGFADPVENGARLRLIWSPSAAKPIPQRQRSA